MKKEQHQRKIRLTNRIIDTYFDIDTENCSPDAFYRFMEWMENGDYEAEKNAALFRKIRDIKNQVQQLFSAKTPPAKDRLWKTMHT